LRLQTLVPMNIEVPTKYPLSQDRIVVFEIRLHSKSPMLYSTALNGNWNALSLARRALKDKFPTQTVPLTTVLQNSQAFLPDAVISTIYDLHHLWNSDKTAGGCKLLCIKHCHLLAFQIRIQRQAGFSCCIIRLSSATFFCWSSVFRTVSF
jgi:hypothetical protein